MARLLALDWDRLEARIIVARAQGSDITVDQVASVPLDLEGQENNLDGLEEELTKAIASQRFPKSQALTAVGRSLVELRTLKLPPAPDEEMPDMVRFQAMREFSSLQEESPLDFVPLGEAGLEPGEVMAAAIPRDLFKHIETAISSQGHEPVRSVMRPCSSASLALRRHPDARNGVTLVISQQSDSAELAVTKDGIVVFTRSFRLPPNWHPGETGEPLLGEVRRTIAAAQNQLGGATVDRIVMFGTPGEHQKLCDRLADRTGVQLLLTDPFEGIKNSGDQPAQPERFAALVGMLHDEAEGHRPAIDFHNPRKRPEPKSNRQRNTLYAATAATVLLGVVFMVWWNFNSLDKDIAARKQRINALNREYKKFESSVMLEDILDKWKSEDRNLLDELLYLSTSESLSAEDFRLISLSTQTHPHSGRGVIELRGRSKDLESQQQLQNELTDEFHEVLPLRTKENEKDDERYPLSFSTTILTERSIPIVQSPMAEAEPASPQQVEQGATTEVTTNEKEAT